MYTFIHHEYQFVLQDFHDVCMQHIQPIHIKCYLPICQFIFGMIIDSSVGLSAGICLLEIRFQRRWVQILHSAEEDNLSPFDSISLPCYQCIKINAKKCKLSFLCNTTRHLFQQGSSELAVSSYFCKKDASLFSTVILGHNLGWWYHLRGSPSISMVNPLWPGDAIGCWRSWSTLIQVTASCLLVASHYGWIDADLSSVKSGDNHLMVMYTSAIKHKN